MCVNSSFAFQCYWEFSLKVLRVTLVVVAFSHYFSHEPQVAKRLKEASLRKADRGVNIDQRWRLTT